MLNKSHKLSGLVLIAALILTLAANLLASSGAEAAPPSGGPPGRGGCRPGGSTWPQCQGAGLQINVGWQPNVAVPGQPFTYTLSLYAGGVQPATNIELDVPLIGNQKYVSYDPGTSGWPLLVAPSEITNTIRINAGSLGVGQTSPSIKVTTLFPIVSAPVLQIYVNASWNDANGFTSRGRAIDLSVDLSQDTPAPVPSLPPAPGPTPSPFANAAPAFMQVPDPGPNVTNSQNWYFATTGHTLDNQLGFLAFWLGHGSVTVLGFPLSQVYTDADTSYQSQYFERGVLEYHPNNPDPYKVELRSLGRELGQVQPAIQANQPPSPNSVFYPQTGHWLDARFADFWQSNGGLTQFGFPISEPITQPDGKVVQWFERARFEYTVSTTGYGFVQLGLVGRESAISKKYLPY